MGKSTGVRGGGWTGGSDGVKCRQGVSSEVEDGDPIPAAELTGDPQDGSQVPQVHFHGRDLSGGVGGQDEVSRVLVLLGVAAGDAEMDAAILLQQPPAQRQPHAAVNDTVSDTAPSGAAASRGGMGLPRPVPDRPSPAPLWCLPCPVPAAHPLAPVTSTTRSIAYSRDRHRR